MYILLEINLSKKHLKWGFSFLFAVILAFLRPLVAVPVGYVGIILEHGKVRNSYGRRPSFAGSRIPGDSLSGLPGSFFGNASFRSSRDLQTVNAAISLYYHIDPSQAGELYQKEGISFEDNLIAPIIQESLQQ